MVARRPADRLQRPAVGGLDLCLYVAIRYPGADLWTVRADGSGEPQPFVATQDQQFHGSFSPDRRHVVYSTRSATGTQIYVQDFPPTGRPWQVSTEGEREPVWTADGSAIYYLSAEA